MYIRDTRKPYEKLGISKTEYLNIINEFLTTPMHIQQLAEHFRVDKSTMKNYVCILGKQDMLIVKKDREFWRSKFSTEKETINYIQDLMNQDKSSTHIAAIFQTTATSICKFVNKHEIKKPRAKLKDRTYLHDLYVNQNMSTSDIAQLIGVTGAAVQQYLHKHNITIRDGSNRQKIASIKRFAAIYQNPDYDATKQYCSRGYCVRYQGYFCRSLNELTWLMLNIRKWHSLTKEPFQFHNYTPDFVANSAKVFEIKGSRKDLDAQQLSRYETLSASIKTELGFDFEIAYMYEDNRVLYEKLRAYIKNKGARLGSTLILKDGELDEFEVRYD